jgi:hypothetical protein
MPESFSNAFSRTSTIPASMGPIVLAIKMNLLVVGLPKPAHDKEKTSNNNSPIPIHFFIFISFSPQLFF